MKNLNLLAILLAALIIAGSMACTPTEDTPADDNTGDTQVSLEDTEQGEAPVDTEGLESPEGVNEDVDGDGILDETQATGDEPAGMSIGADGNMTFVGADGETVVYEVTEDGTTSIMVTEDGETTIVSEGNSGQLTTTTEDGVSTIEVNEGALPENWPDETLIMPGLQIEGGVSQAMQIEGVEIMTIGLTGDIPLSDVHEYYSNLEGWEVMDLVSMESTENMAFNVVLTKDFTSVSIMGSEDAENGTEVVVSYTIETPVNEAE